MGTHLHLDFETYSEIDIKKCGAHVYARHPSTEVLCLAYSWEDSDAVHLWVPSMSKDHISHLTEQALFIHGHNVGFEQLILRFLFDITVPVQKLRDSAAVCAYYAYPRALDKAGEVLQIKNLKYAREGKLLISRLCRPKKPTKVEPYTRRTLRTHPDEFSQLYEYCKQDVRAEKELTEILGDLPPREQQVWEMDNRINNRGVKGDLELAQSVLLLAERMTQKREAKCRDISNGAFDRTSQRDKTMSWINHTEKYSLPDYKADTLAAAIKDPDIPPDVREILVTRILSSKTSISKFKHFHSLGRIIRGILLYQGAPRTGRWSGRILQPHNLPRPMFEADEVEETTIPLALEQNFELLELLYGEEGLADALVSCIRGAFIARKGKRFVVSDFSNVEGRVLFWVADDGDGLDLFRRDEDLYIEMAYTIYGKGEVIVGGDKRRMGKLAILGLGYGMGAPKFVATALEKAELTIELEFATKVRDAYRDRFQMVPALWRALERTAVKAVQNPGKWFKANDKVSYIMEDRGLRCLLPSGRSIYYPSAHVRQKRTPWGAMKPSLFYYSLIKNQWRVESTFGGKLAENVVQAISRDLLASAMLRLEARDWPIVLHVHDEVVTEVSGEFTLAHMMGIFETLPTWARGLPIKSSGWTGLRFAKR